MMSAPLLLLLIVCSAFAFSDEQAVVEQYRDYLRRFGKSEERALNPTRVDRFKASLQYVARQNEKFEAGQTRFLVGLNEMSDWLVGELRQRFAPPVPYLSIKGVNDSSSGAESLSDSVGAVNWASSENRLGRSIVPPIRNQGTCGACWAFVAVAAVEASVHLNSNFSNPIPLSAQELIDCDTTFNRGCQGGNPLYAFEYAMVKGLTGWADYGYKEKAEDCQRRKFPARAGIEGFTRVTPQNDQRALLRAVSSSPVAVGICGTDQGFVAYESGVFDSRDCCITQNHALLIVGYGHDKKLKADFWLAQNSWGQSWGEQGYIRLLRSADGNSTGQCGLATSPCAAKGGYIMHPEQEGMFGAGELLDPHGGKRAEAALLFWLEAHWRQAMLGVSACLLVASLALLLCEGRVSSESET